MAKKIKSTTVRKKTNSRIVTPFNIISLKNLSEITGMDYFVLRNNLVTKKYSTLRDVDKTQIANSLFIELKKVFADLGCEITIKKLH